MQPPRIKGFHPIGNQRHEKEVITLFLEEYETIRLLDYDSLSQAEAAKVMQVSRPTLTRIYQSARNKVAQALVEGSIVQIQGGHSVLSDTWSHCPNCDSRYSNHNAKQCPLCSPTDSNITAFAVSQQGAGGTIYPAFGKAPWFVIADHNERVVTVENSINGEPHTGLKVVEMIHKLGATTIAAYEIGVPVQEKALQYGMNLVLLSHGIQSVKKLLALIKHQQEAADADN